MPSYLRGRSSPFLARLPECLALLALRAAHGSAAHGLEFIRRLIASTWLMPSSTNTLLGNSPLTHDEFSPARNAGSSRKPRKKGRIDFKVGYRKKMKDGY